MTAFAVLAPLVRQTSVVTSIQQDLPEGADLREWSERHRHAATAVRLAALAALALSLLRDGDTETVVVAAVGCVGWLVWTLAVPSRGRVSMAGALCFGLCGAVLLGSGRTDTLGYAFVWAASIHFALLPKAYLGVPLSLGLAVAGALTSVVHGHGVSVLAIASTSLGGWALGTARRYRVARARQAYELLAETRRANAEQAQAAALAERARIARDIHDVLAHTLSGLSIQLEAVDALLTDGRDPARAHAMVTRARRTARDGLDECRRAVAALRDEVKPLPETLTALVEDYRTDTGSAASLVIEVGGPGAAGPGAGGPGAAGPGAAGPGAPEIGALRCAAPYSGDESAMPFSSAVPPPEGTNHPVGRLASAVTPPAVPPPAVPPPLPVEAAQAIQRVAQEALTNIRKHAPGAAVTVVLTVGADEAAITVDNTVGTGGSAPLSGSGGGFGLVGLRERIDLLGGRLESGPPSGTDAPDGIAWRVRAVVPLSSRAAAVG